MPYFILNQLKTIQKIGHNLVAVSTALYGSCDDFLSIVLLVFRTCLHKKCVRIFEHNFVADKAKIRRRADARQGFLTQSAAKFAEKTCAYACEDGF